MIILVADDEPLALSLSVKSVRENFPNEDIQSFSRSTPLIEYASSTPVDIAFLDINLRGVTGIAIAEILKKTNPRCNIIFVTGFDEFKSEAMDLHASGYIMKPVTAEKVKAEIQELRYPIEFKVETNKIYIKCLGNFECFINNVPIEFSLSKTKELLAYLFDCSGALVSNNEIMSALWEDDSHDNYLRQLKKDLIDTFTSFNLSDLIFKQWGKIGLDVSKIKSDVDNVDEIRLGEYMIQYSWAETPNINKKKV